MDTTSFYPSFFINMQTANDHYHLAAFGAVRKSDRLAQLIDELDEKEAAGVLSKDDIVTALTETISIDNEQDEAYKNYETDEIEWPGIRAQLINDLEKTRAMPQLSRENSIISMASLFEFFIDDLLREIFLNDRENLIKGSIRVNIKDLIDSLDDDSTVDLIIKQKINGLRDSVYKKISKLGKYGIDVDVPESITELYLVRNCLVHNQKKVDLKLESAVDGSRYVKDDAIDVTEDDFYRFRRALEKAASDIFKDYKTSVSR